jgi:small-conductance mechanosensitive channel
MIHRTLDKVDVPRVPVPISPDFRVAILAILAAIGCLIASTYGKPSFGPNVPTHLQILAWAGAGGFLLFGIIAVRSIASQVNRVLAARTGPGHAGVVRWLILLIGYLIVIFAFLSLIQIRAVRQVLVGGAITGIILGIAAQNALGNLFAGIVLLMARPFNIGDRIRIRSGALGGETIGEVTGMGLTYITLMTDDGPLSLPNSGVLAAGIGPAPLPPPPDDPDGTVPAEAEAETADSASKRLDGRARRAQKRQRIAGLRSGA